jgi:hypothetical protein
MRIYGDLAARWYLLLDPVEDHAECVLEGLGSEIFLARRP